MRAVKWLSSHADFCGDRDLTDKEHVGMYFAVACGAKSQTRLWLSGCRSLSAIESGVAHFSGVLVLLCVACVKQGLNLDRNTFCYVGKELTFQTDCIYGWLVLPCRDC